MTRPSGDAEWGHVRNLGLTSIEMLRDVGIDNPSDLDAIGPVAAYEALRDAHPGSVSLNMLWALAGAELDLDWRQLPPEVKRQLRDRVRRRC